MKGVPVPSVHRDEVEIDLHVVRTLLEDQFPEWADLPLARFPSYGTDNAVFRLGGDLYVRMPRIRAEVPTWAINQIRKEAEWLPRLAPHLPVEVPVVVAHGEPNADYAYGWAVYRWLSGQTPVEATTNLAHDLAAFVIALHRIDPVGAPAVLSRARPLHAHDAATRASLDQLHDEIDVPTATRAWESALQASAWERPPVWVHGDLLASNMLVRDGRLAAVIDWGSCCAGDPACDLMIAWSLLAPVRGALRDAVDLDAATWERGRGWALSQAVIALPYYKHTNPPMAAHARSAISGVLADVERSAR